jgi:hypothetical protein
MAAATELARLRREIDTLVEVVNQALRPNAKPGMTPAQRRALKSEIQDCMQMLDELGTRLSG